MVWGADVEGRDGGLGGVNEVRRGLRRLCEESVEAEGAPAACLRDGRASRRGLQVEEQEDRQAAAEADRVIIAAAPEVGASVAAAAAAAAERFVRECGG